MKRGTDPPRSLRYDTIQRFRKVDQLRFRLAVVCSLFLRLFVGKFASDDAMSFVNVSDVIPVLSICTTSLLMTSCVEMLFVCIVAHGHICILPHRLQLADSSTLLEVRSHFGSRVKQRVCICSFFLLWPQGVRPLISGLTSNCSVLQNATAQSLQEAFISGLAPERAC